MKKKIIKKNRFNSLREYSRKLGDYSEYFDTPDRGSCEFCCGMYEIGNFVDNSFIKVVADDNDITLESAKQEYKDTLIYSLRATCSTTKDYPFIAALLTKEQSYIITMFRQIAKDFPGKFKFHKTKSGSTGNNLTIVIYVP